MRLTVNGEVREYARPPSLRDVLRDMGADRAKVAVMLNGRVVPSAARDGVALADGDALEVLTLAAGG